MFSWVFLIPLSESHRGAHPDYANDISYRKMGSISNWIFGDHINDIIWYFDVQCMECTQQLKDAKNIINLQCYYNDVLAFRLN